MAIKTNRLFHVFLLISSGLVNVEALSTKLGHENAEAAGARVTGLMRTEPGLLSNLQQLVASAEMSLLSGLHQVVPSALFEQEPAVATAGAVTNATAIADAAGANASTDANASVDATTGNATIPAASVAPPPVITTTVLQQKIQTLPPITTTPARYTGVDTVHRTITKTADKTSSSHQSMSNSSHKTQDTSHHAMNATNYSIKTDIVSLKVDEKPLMNKEYKYNEEQLALKLRGDNDTAADNVTDINANATGTNLNATDENSNATGVTFSPTQKVVSNSKTSTHVKRTPTEVTHVKTTETHHSVTNTARKNNTYNQHNVTVTNVTTRMHKKLGKDGDADAEVAADRERNSDTK